MSNAFLTGSRVYGTPRDDSDVDLVVKLSKEDRNFLWEFSSDEGLRFGKLNIIAVDDVEFDIWKKVTDELVLISPVTREVAVAKFKEAGIGKYEYVCGGCDTQTSRAIQNGHS